MATNGFDKLLGRFMTNEGPRELVRLIRRLPPSRVPILGEEAVAQLIDYGFLDQEVVYPPMSIAEMLGHVAPRIERFTEAQTSLFDRVCNQCFNRTAHAIHAGAPPNWYN